MAAFPKTVEIVLTAAITLVMLLVIPNQSFVEGPVTQSGQANGVLKGFGAVGDSFAPWVRIWWPYTVHSALWRLANVNTKEKMLPTKTEDLLTGGSWLSTDGRFHPSPDTVSQHGNAPAFKVGAKKSKLHVVKDNKDAREVHKTSSSEPVMMMVRAKGCPPCEACEGECQKVCDAAAAGKTAMRVADLYINDTYKDDVSEFAKAFKLTQLGTPMFAIVEDGVVQAEHKGERTFEKLQEFMDKHQTSGAAKPLATPTAANRVVVDRTAAPSADGAEDLLPSVAPAGPSVGRTSGKAFAIDTLESAVAGPELVDAAPMPRGREAAGAVDASARSLDTPMPTEAPSDPVEGPHDPWLAPATTGRAAPSALLSPA